MHFAPARSSCAPRHGSEGAGPAVARSKWVGIEANAKLQTGAFKRINRPQKGVFNEGRRGREGFSKSRSLFSASEHGLRRYTAHRPPAGVISESELSIVQLFARTAARVFQDWHLRMAAVLIATRSFE